MSGGIVMRIHRVRSELVVAACDEELIGQELAIGSQGHTVRVTAHFYGERVVSKEELVWALQRATIANLLGTRVVGLAAQEGLVQPDSCGTLGGVPHAEIVSVVD